jgi:hypothetical protein
VSVLFLVSLLLLLLLTPANECVHDVANISAAAGIPLVPDVLTVAGFPCFCWRPWCCHPSAVAFIPAVVGVSAVAVVPAVYGIFAVASFPANPGVPMLL